MEIQLNELIDQIKKDGVEVAENEAKTIIDSAREEAEKIINDAKTKADKILSDAKIENEKMVKSSEDAIKQAGRNLLISFRESIVKELKAIVLENVNSVFNADDFAKIIVNSVEAWSKNPESEDISLILNSEDLEKLEKTILSALNEKMIKGVTLKASDSFDGGFRISVNNGEAYYDYSAEAVVDMFSNYLSPKVTKLLKEAQ